MYKGILHTHYLSVTLFLLIYVIKTILLLSDKKELLLSFAKRTKVFEMVISVLFLLTGIYLAMQLPFQGKYDYLFWIKLIMVFAAIPIAIVGFKKGNKILAALSLLLITGSFGIAEVYSKKKGIPKEEITVAESASGQNLYETYCANCHGGDGKLGLAGAKDLSISVLDESEIRRIVRHGKGSMPPVSKTVSDDQIELISNYVISGISSKEQ
jgi:uncharacterized membrane protein SirB2